MHDGYLFTLGICGSAAAGHPALHVLDAMLAALPPVKRALYLGAVQPSGTDGTWQEPLLAPLIADLADAEILLLATPAPPGGLPGRLRAALNQLPVADRRASLQVVAVAVGPAAEQSLAWLQSCFAAPAIHFRSLALAPDDVFTAMPRALDLSRDAYRCARVALPAALPHEGL
jgi:hypothetical protein